ncbi:MAG: hypothetical protein ACHQFW_07955 [Chitinophagales bacterium]
MSNFRVSLVETKGYMDRDIQKATEALYIFQNVFNSQSFLNRILNFNLPVGFLDYDNRTNLQILNALLEGKEWWEDEADEIASLTLILDMSTSPNDNIVGYTLSNDDSIYTYADKFDNMLKSELAAHYAHEYCHLIGFDDIEAQSGDFYFSVPYAVQKIVNELSPANEIRVLATTQPQARRRGRRRGRRGDG